MIKIICNKTKTSITISVILKNIETFRPSVVTVKPTLHCIALNTKEVDRGAPQGPLIICMLLIFKLVKPLHMFDGLHNSDVTILFC